VQPPLCDEVEERCDVLVIRTFEVVGFIVHDFGGAELKCL